MVAHKNYIFLRPRFQKVGTYHKIFILCVLLIVKNSQKPIQIGSKNHFRVVVVSKFHLRRRVHIAEGSKVEQANRRHIRTGTERHAVTPTLMKSPDRMMGNQNTTPTMSDR